MLRGSVDWHVCLACEDCTARLVCQTRAVMKVDPDDPAWIETSRCNGCGDCLAACVYGAISLIVGDGRSLAI